MRIFDRKIPFILLVGDVFCFIIALWITLFIRYGALPDRSVFLGHLVPFFILFLIWIIVFFIAGLYEKRSFIIRGKLSELIFKTQIINSVIAVAFFYFVPLFAITPKTILFIHLAVSLPIIILWRSQGYYIFGSKIKEKAILVGSGNDMKSLAEEINTNGHYNFYFARSIDVSVSTDLIKSVNEAILAENVSLLVVDFENEKIKSITPSLYNLIFSKIRFISMEKVYEDVFDKVSLSILKESWFLEHISRAPKVVYDTMKRIIDIIFATLGGLITLLFYPFIALAIKMDDGGAVFIVQKRIGEDGKIIFISKFRSMKENDSGKWVVDGDDRITRVGKFLRNSRIDEFPQFWSIVRGDLSFIGPRPDIQDLGVKLSQEIPYYNIRNLIKPGLSGWAQIKQDSPPQSLEETKIRLAYDFYYIKNRSLILDIKIILKTLKTLLSRTGK